MSTPIATHFEMLMPREEQERIGATPDVEENLRVMRVLYEYEILRARLAEVERERDEAKKECDRLHKAGTDTWSELRQQIHKLERERDEAQLHLASIGDIAVGNWDDATVGAVDSVVKEPRRYKDALRVLFVDNQKTIAQLLAANARLRESLELMLHVRGTSEDTPEVAERARAALAQTEVKQS